MLPTLNRGLVFDPIVGSHTVPETHYPNPLPPKVLGTRGNTWLNPKMTEKLLLLNDVGHNLTEPKKSL